MSAGWARKWHRKVSHGTGGSSGSSDRCLRGGGFGRAAITALGPKTGTVRGPRGVVRMRRLFWRCCTHAQAVLAVLCACASFPLGFMRRRGAAVAPRGACAVKSLPWEGVFVRMRRAGVADNVVREGGIFGVNSCGFGGFSRPGGVLCLSPRHARRPELGVQEDLCHPSAALREIPARSGAEAHRWGWGENWGS